MTPFDLQLAAIVAKISAIPKIGVVHDYERYANDLNALKKHYVSTIDGKDQLRGWFMQRGPVKESSRALGRYEEEIVWRGRGYMALSDENQSEKVFQALLEAIRDAFRTDETLGGTVSTTVTNDAAGIQITESGPVMFAGVLCHAASLTLTTRRYF